MFVHIYIRIHIQAHDMSVRQYSSNNPVPWIDGGGGPIAFAGPKTKVSILGVSATMYSRSLLGLRGHFGTFCMIRLSWGLLLVPDTRALTIAHMHIHT